MRAVLTATVVASALALSAHAPIADGAQGPGDTAGAQPSQCFNIRQVRSFSPGRPDQVFLRVGSRDVYELSTDGDCPDVDFATGLVMVPDTAGLVGSRLCTDDWARISTPGRTQRAICRAQIRDKLTAAQVAALPAAHRP